MFITHNAFRSPLSKLSSDADEQLWNGVTLVFQMQWVMLTMQLSQVDEDGDNTVTFKTIFLSNFASLLEKTFLAAEGDAIKLVSSYIVMPTTANPISEFDWSMEPIAKVWLAESDDDPGATIEVCETMAGKRHIVTRFVDQNIRLKNLKLILDFNSSKSK